MLFPRAVFALPAELPAPACDGPVAKEGSAAGGVPCGYGKKTEIHRTIAFPFDEAAATGPGAAGAAEAGP
jgi:hypothetical protein